MLKEENICKKCILPEGFLGLSLNSNGECKFCSDPDYENINWKRRFISRETRKKALDDWNSVVRDMQNNHGKTKYDCVLGYSGGKDSTALLHYLVNDLGLNPLCVSSDTGFMTEIAKENMKMTLKEIDVDHIMIEECIPTFAKLYKHLFISHDSDEIFLSRYICDYCSDLIHSIVVKEAIKLNIPYVLFGYSPDQIYRYFYEMPRDEVIMHWRPKMLESKPFDSEDGKWYLNDGDIYEGNVPRVLLPYHVIPYKEQDIIALVESEGLIPKGHADPLLTNCNVVHAAQFYDMNRYGSILYALQYAELVRQDPDIRKKWLMTVKHSFPLILNNTFKPAAVDQFFEVVGMTEDELLDVIEKHIEGDPNKELIEKNKTLFTKRKKKRVRAINQ